MNRFETCMNGDCDELVSYLDDYITTTETNSVKETI